jgi:hypothetical protein
MSHMLDWRNVGAGERVGLENGSGWRMVGAGEWQSLENGSRWGNIDWKQKFLLSTSMEM